MKYLNFFLLQAQSYQLNLWIFVTIVQIFFSSSSFDNWYSNTNVFRLGFFSSRFDQIDFESMKTRRLKRKSHIGFLRTFDEFLFLLFNFSLWSFCERFFFSSYHLKHIILKITIVLISLLQHKWYADVVHWTWNLMTNENVNWTQNENVFLIFYEVYFNEKWRPCDSLWKKEEEEKLRRFNACRIIIRKTENVLQCSDRWC